MSTANPIVRPSLGFSWVHWVVRAGLLAWAGFWGWFAAAVVIGEARGGERGGIPYAAALIVILAGLLFAAFRWPRLGGALLVAAGGVLQQRGGADVAGRAGDRPWGVVDAGAGQAGLMPR